MDKPNEKVVAAPESIKEHQSAVAIVSLDNLGIAASSLCLVHCLAMPFVIAFLPLLGWQFLEGRPAHRILAFFVFSFAVFAVVPGYWKHKKTSVLLSMLFGLSLVLIATFTARQFMPERLELPLITLGNLILVATHWRNRALAECRHNHAHAVPAKS
jgi:prepilin signal peptidase PulO-like enzyme (type II secretory pathway)